MPEKIPPPLTSGQVLGKQRWLEKNTEHKATVLKMRDRWRLHSMLDMPELQPDLTRHGRAVIVNSPRIMETKKTLIADILSYTTDARVFPQVPTKEKNRREALLNKAQELEKNVVIAKDQLDDGRRVDKGVLEHLLVSSYACVILECFDCYDDDGGVEWCWNLSLPAPDTCFFNIDGAPFRPQEFARRYRQPIGLCEERYSGQKGGMFDGYKLKRNNKEWDFKPHGDDKPVEASKFSADGDPEGDVEECEIVVYYDQWRCYHVVVNGGFKGTNEDTGEIVFCEEHRVKGGPPVWIMSGATSEIRGERLQPFLWAVMQMIKVLNLDESIIATRSYNMKPDVFIEWEPADLRAMADAGYLKPASQLQLESGMANLIDIGGKPHYWEIPPDEELRLQVDRKTKELQDYLQQIQAITSYEVLEKSTLGLGLVAAGHVETQQNPMLKQRDWMWAQVLEAWCDSCQDYMDDPAFPPEGWQLYAKAGQRYSKGEFEGGEGLSLNKDTFDKWSWVIDVTTSNQTEAMVRVRLEDWARGNELRGRALEELGEVLGYPDNDAWLEMMARDDVVRLSATAYAGFVQAAGNAWLLTHGINVGALQAFWQPPDMVGGQGGTGGQGGATRPPSTEPSPGGSNELAGAGGMR